MWVALALLLGLGWGVFASRIGGGRDQRTAPSLTDGLEGARPASADFDGLTSTRLAVGELCLRLVVADQPEERSTGLRGRETIGRYDGMLFVSETDSLTGFTMSDVPVPLDIAWFDRRGRRVDAAEMEPCPGGERCPAYASGRPWRFALETLRGELPSGSLDVCT
jgi:uncharacterized membrane protein (UPF0127 family)